MPVTITGIYDSSDKIRNAEDDLRASGIPRENYFVDEEAMQIKIMISESIKPEILAILGRHNPTRLS